jgi:hypothetical protein
MSAAAEQIVPDHGPGAVVNVDREVGRDGYPTCAPIAQYAEDHGPSLA